MTDTSSTAYAVPLLPLEKACLKPTLDLINKLKANRLSGKYK